MPVTEGGSYFEARFNHLGELVELFVPENLVLPGGAELNEEQAEQFSGLPEFIVRGLDEFFSGKEPDQVRTRSVFVNLSPWQEKIVRLLIKIPRGRVVTYRRLAELAGSPQAARAVGTACARNPIPLLFPCHRVVRSDRRPGAYAHRAWAPLKIALLEFEGLKLDSRGRILEEFFW